MLTQRRGQTTCECCSQSARDLAQCLTGHQGAPRAVHPLLSERLLHSIEEWRVETLPETSEPSRQVKVTKDLPDLRCSQESRPQCNLDFSIGHQNQCQEHCFSSPGNSQITWSVQFIWPHHNLTLHRGCLCYTRYPLRRCGLKTGEQAFTPTLRRQSHSSQCARAHGTQFNRRPTLHNPGSFSNKS